MRPPHASSRQRPLPFHSLLALLLALWLAACAKAPALAPLPPGAVVLAFGDSVTFGTGAAPGADYPTQLGALTGWDVRNHGVPGDTAQAARARIEAAIEETRPALVIVEIGGNDFLKKRPEAAVRDDIRAILDVARARKIPAVLVAVPKFSLFGTVAGRLEDSPIYAALADEARLPLVANVFAEVLSDPSLKADPIHPNAPGYRRLAEGIAEQLRHSGLLARH